VDLPGTTSAGVAPPQSATNCLLAPSDRARAWLAAPGLWHRREPVVRRHDETGAHAARSTSAREAGDHLGTFQVLAQPRLCLTGHDLRGRCERGQYAVAPALPACRPGCDTARGDRTRGALPGTDVWRRIWAIQ